MEATANGTLDKLTADKADGWRNHIGAQRASGQSIRAWCQANNAREHSFYWWRARLGLSPRRRKTLPLPRRSKPIAFAQVLVDAPATAQPPAAGFVDPLRLRFADQRELILPASMPLEQVARLLCAIEDMVRRGGSGGPA